MRRCASKIIIFSIFFVLIVAKSAVCALLPPIGYVNDFAKILDPNTIERLNSILSTFEQQTSDEIAVVTVDTLEGMTIEDYAVKLYQQWGIGKKGKDNGILILVAPKEKQVRIEVGYGLESIINDAKAGRIIREKMVPEFKVQEFSNGILNGTLTILNIIAKEKGIEFNFPPNIKITNNHPDAQKSGGIIQILGSIFLFFLLAYLFIRHPWLFLLFLSSIGRGGTRGGGFGGGFGGFGGGLSGGGGASGRW